MGCVVEAADGALIGAGVLATGCVTCGALAAVAGASGVTAAIGCGVVVGVTGTVATVLSTAGVLSTTGPPLSPNTPPSGNGPPLSPNTPPSDNGPPSSPNTPPSGNGPPSGNTGAIWTGATSTVILNSTPPTLKPPRASSNCASDSGASVNSNSSPKGSDCADAD